MRKEEYFDFEKEKSIAHRAISEFRSSYERAISSLSLAFIANEALKKDIEEARHEIATLNKTIEMIYQDRKQPIEEPKEEWEPFDADKWTPDRVVKTIDGKDIRILCTDRDSNYPIVGLMKRNEGEVVYVYTKDGKIADNNHMSNRNLMMLKLNPGDKPHNP